MIKHCITTVLLLISAFTAIDVSAYDLPVINLGLTSFLDGALPSGPGFYYQNYVQYYDANRFMDSRGDRLPLPKQDLTLTAEINQFTYYSPNKIGPGRFALDLVVPYVTSVSTKDGLGGAALRSQDGLGDILFAPIYQLDPIITNHGWVVMQDFELDILAPTGDYDRNREINPGGNAWALDPFYAATLLSPSGLSFSTRLHYLYNFTNNSPIHALGPDVDSVQAGQAFHANFTIGYALTKQLTLGLNGYFLKQLTDTKFNGEAQSGRRERVLGLGPGLFATFNKDTFLFVNAYFESMVENRTRGTRLVVRFVHHFSHHTHGGD